MTGGGNMENYSKWVACWGNATSIITQTATNYSKDLTLRYPIWMCFSGSALRIHFSNLTGTEPVSFRAGVARAVTDKTIDPATMKPLTKDGDEQLTIMPGEEIVTDILEYDITAGEKLSVNMFLEGYAQMNSGTLVTGPLSKGFYSYGDHRSEAEMPIDLTRNTNWFYFINTVDVLTEEKNMALICYGDSITAQAWPDYLKLYAWENNYRNVSVIRRAVSGTRILRQYDCITYAGYGLKGETRFPIEGQAAGATTILIQHGINDIIHPVGTDENVFRPWSDMPDAEDLIEGVKNFYIKTARERGLSVWCGTLLPIYGWRTYAEFREKIRTEYNQWVRTTDLIDGYIDFDDQICNFEHGEQFDDGNDSGDHLHPSELGYQRMAKAALPLVRMLSKGLSDLSE